MLTLLLENSHQAFYAGLLLKKRVTVHVLGSDIFVFLFYSADWF